MNLRFKKMNSIVMLTMLAAAVCALVGCAPARAGDAETLSDNFYSATYSDCATLAMRFKPLDGDVPVMLNMSSIFDDGTNAARCAQPQMSGEKEISAVISTGDGRMIKARLEANPNDVPGVLALDLKPIEKGNIKWKFTFNAEKGEHFYGFGEKFNALDQRGKLVRIMNKDKHAHENDDIKFEKDRSYKTVPFFMSSRGYGLWLEDTSVAYFDMDSDGRGKWTLRFESDSARLYFIAGPRLTQVLERYMEFTGRPPMWPAWVFAPWKSRNVHNSRAEFEEDVLRQREVDVPGSVIVIDSPWETCYNDYKFNEAQFHDSKGMLQLAHDQGYKVVLWLTPMINVWNNVDMQGIKVSLCGNYDGVRKHGGFVLGKDGKPIVSEWWKGRGSMLDFTFPEAADYWKRNLVKLFEYGADGIKIDDGESQFVMDGVYRDGTPGTKMQNYYSVLYNKYTYEAVQEGLKGDGVVFARSGAAGSQKYTVPWAGDNFADFGEYGLPSVVIAGQAMAMSGFPLWAHDVGGYIGTQSDETFIRWTQFGALSPVMQMHTTTNKGCWDFGDTGLSVYRKYAKLHTSLFPYIYALNAEAARDGMPIIRPLPLLYQNDAEAHKPRFEYLFGPDILAGPVVVEGATTKEMYFPKGDTWIDFWSGKTFAGGTVATVAAPLADMPLFVRAGAIIPMLPPDVDTLVDKKLIKDDKVIAMDDRLDVLVYPGPGKSGFETVDGVKLSGAPEAGGYRLCASGAAKRAIFKFNIAGAASVMIDGAAMKKLDNCAALAYGDPAWCADSARGIVAAAAAIGANDSCITVAGGK